MLLLLACTTTLDEAGEQHQPAPDESVEEVGGNHPDETVDGGDQPTEEITGPGDTGDDGDDGDNDWIFDQSFVHTVEILIEPEVYNELAAASEAYASDYWVEADVTFDGVPMASSGLRLKGRWGSWRSLAQKAAFKIDFNRYVDQDLDGLEGLTLNNMVVDYSFLKEHVAYGLYREAGVAASRTSYVWVTVNGADFGLYLNVESVDDEFLKRHFDDPSGNLYDADYILWDDGTYTVLDFFHDAVPLFEQEEGTDTSRADLTAMADLVVEHGGQDDWYEASAELVDWPAMHTMVAVEMWIGQNDGYSLNQNNYLPYFDPTTGLVTIVPWDNDYAFLYASEWGFSWTNPRGYLTAYCLAHAVCRSDLVARVDEVATLADDLLLVDEITAMNAIIEPFWRVDPRREASDWYTEYYQGYLRSWSTRRSGELRSMWGL